MGGQVVRETVVQTRLLGCKGAHCECWREGYIVVRELDDAFVQGRHIRTWGDLRHRVATELAVEPSRLALYNQEACAHLGTDGGRVGVEVDYKAARPLVHGNLVAREMWRAHTRCIE